MDGIKISPSRDTFEQGGKKFFYLADTVWLAIAKATLHQWEEYLEYRKEQGFNTLQIQIIPDISVSKPYIDPFKFNSKGTYDYNNINEEYFDKADEMMKMATDRGFILSLAPLWCNFVKDSWAWQLNPKYDMPIEMVEPYLEYVFKRFSKFNPVYMISGDTRFESDELCEYYRKGLKKLKSLYPNSLATMHLNPETDLLDEFVNSEYLDFYMYQSDHDFSRQCLCYKWAENYYNKPVKRPIVNGEPCYEGFSYENRKCRFSSFDVRRAFWHSVLAGAKAGFAYGGHGVWNWYKQGEEYPWEQWQGIPFNWRAALLLEGAWDVAFSKNLFEQYSMFDLEPCNKVLNVDEEVKMAASPDESKVVIYSPVATNIKVEMDLSGYEFIMYDLKSRYCHKVFVNVDRNKSVIKMSDLNNDVIIIGVK